MLMSGFEGKLANCLLVFGNDFEPFSSGGRKLFVGNKPILLLSDSVEIHCITLEHSF